MKKLSSMGGLIMMIFLSFSLMFNNGVLGIRLPDRISNVAKDSTVNQQTLKTAVFALGSFWRSESVFGCLNGVVRTTAGYAGGAKTNPEFRSLGDHAESVQ
ncbi:hypothetical protein MKW94_024360, partial [Papaver nudicaule]|nr:hypothetical protein [Papaver nudicaule]